MLLKGRINWLKRKAAKEWNKKGMNQKYMDMVKDLYELEMQLKENRRAK